MKSSRRFVTFIFLAALLLFVGCGGGSGGGDDDGSSDGVTYSGSQTQATITEDNGEDLTTAAFMGGIVGANTAVQSASLSGVEDTSLESSKPIMLPLILKDLFSTVDLAAPTYIQGRAVYEDYKQTIVGPDGGEARIDVQYNEETEEFKGSIEFDDYTSGDLKIDGEANWEGQSKSEISDDGSGTVYTQVDKVEVTFDELSVGDTTLQGEIVLDKDGENKIDTEIDYYGEDGDSGETCWVSDYLMEYMENDGWVEMSFKGGRYYDPEEGWVNVSTDEPLKIYDEDVFPFDGIFKCEGFNNTLSILQTLDEETYEIKIDIDGDGEYEVVIGGLLWINIDY